jgi:hypothetical protein
VSFPLVFALGDSKISCTRLQTPTLTPLKSRKLKCPQACFVRSQACSVCARPKPQAGKLASKLLQAQARSSLDLHLPTPSPVPPQCPVLVAIQILGMLEEQRGLYNGGFGPHVRVVVCLILCSHPVLAALHLRRPLSVSPSISLVPAPSPPSPHSHDDRAREDARSALAPTLFTYHL